MDREELYPPRTVKSEEIQILTGMFGRGMQENIVVFSDEYFETLKAEGPSDYYLLKVNQNNYQSVKDKLNKFAEKHRKDSSWDLEIKPYYEKNQMVNDTQSERVLKLAVVGFEILMLCLSTMLIIGLKFVADYKEMKTRYQLLFNMGMRNEEQKRILRREIKPFFMIPSILAAGLAVCFTLQMFRLRMYGENQMLAYLKYLIPVWGIYFLVQACVYQCVKKKLYRTVVDNEGGGE